MLVKWIPIEKILLACSIETLGVCALLMLFSFAFYKFFLKGISEKRHGQMKQRFLNTVFYIGLSTALIIIHHSLLWQAIGNEFLSKFSNYIALIGLIVGAVAVIKIGQILVYLYLFFGHMTSGVPRLIGNLFTFVFSIFIFGLIAALIFDFNIATIATTSAVFSLVLGLALQDTLGNFFSGLALQIDRPFKINDWIEIHTGDEKWVGQIQEINWRATFLLSFADELIMFPNKTIAQSQILILTHPHRPVRLNQMFRFNHDVDIELAKKTILASTQDFPEIMTSPMPKVLVTESTESWIVIKVFYSLHDYGARYRLGDALIQKVIKNAREEGLKFGHQTITIKES
jgi:small-conductance mechanosensitive channel